MELAGGDLRNQYQQKDGREYSFPIGLKIVIGAALGLAHMHTMPEPMIHRDIKSMNIMVMPDGETGKLGDCGESRRVDLTSTMTRTGTPLWAAPELLSGKRFREHVDTYSFGVVLYEIVVRHTPYKGQAASQGKGKRGVMNLAKKVAKGDLRPVLEGDPACKKYGVGGAFQRRGLYVSCGNVIIHLVCIAFEPEDRPSMSEVVLRLQTIYESVETKPIERKKSSASAMVGDEQLTDKAYAFALRVGGTEASAKVEELRDEVEALLGKYAVATVTGVYNSARLYRFLLGNGMDVQDAKSAVVLNNNGRAMLEMDAKRMAIFGSGMGFGTLPQVAEFRKYIPSNPFVGRAKSGEIVDYLCVGSGAKLAEFRKAFSVEDARDLLLFHIELQHLYLDAMSITEGRNISRISFYDCKGATLNALFQMMDYAHAIVDAQKRVAPPCTVTAFFVRNSISPLGAIHEFLNEDFVGTSGKGFTFKVLDAKVDLSDCKPVTDLLDVNMLPVSIGGGATSVSEDGEQDHHFSRGVVHPSIMEFLRQLDEHV